jgi:hypothetical protein
MKELSVRFAGVGVTTKDSRTLVLVAGIVAAFVLAACGGDGGSGPGSTTFKDPTGSYVISTINGKAPPTAIAASDTAGLFLYEITGGTSVLTSDGKYINVLTTRVTVPGSVQTFTDSARGSWTMNGTAVQFTNALDATSVDTASWSNTGKLTFAVQSPTGTGSDTLVYSIKR